MPWLPASGMKQLWWFMPLNHKRLHYQVLACSFQPFVQIYSDINSSFLILWPLSQVELWKVNESRELLSSTGSALQKPMQSKGKPRWLLKEYDHCSFYRIRFYHPSPLWRHRSPQCNRPDQDCHELKLYQWLFTIWNFGKEKATKRPSKVTLSPLQSIFVNNRYRQPKNTILKI